MNAGKKSSFTSKERKGIISLAIVSMVITGGGFALRFCSNTVNTSHNREGILTDSLESADEGRMLFDGSTDTIGETVRKKKKTRKKKSSDKGKRRQGKTSEIPYRDPLSDTIPYR